MKKIAAPILEISNLCKKEKEKNINRLNLIIPKGESMALLYKNEENIELLCDILKGQKKTDKGKIFFKGTNITGVKNIFGVIEKKPDISKSRTVTDLASAPIANRGLSKKMANVLVQKELSTFGLEEYGDKKVSLLPNNLLRRAELFSAYMCSHELIVINEPFIDLENDEREAELKLLENVKNNSELSLLLFTKQISLALRFADSVMIVDDNTEPAGIISVDKRQLDRTIFKINELYDIV